VRSHRIIGTTLFVLAVTTLNALPARSAVSSLNLPLTPREQATQLWLLAKPETMRRLFPSTTAETKLYYFQRNYRREYLAASINERSRWAEKIGEQGRARFAAERGWTPLLGSRNRGIKQGPDSVYWDPRSGRVRVLEAKGGTSQVKRGYESWQDKNTYSIRAAERLLRSSNATKPAKVGAARVIVAAQQRGGLATGVVRTDHVYGKHGAPTLEKEWNSDNVRNEAKKIERDVTQENPHTRRIFREARKEQSVAMLKYRTAQGVAILGVVGIAGLGWDAYRQFSVGWQMLNDPTLDGNPLPYFHTGVALGRAGQLTTLGASSSATFMRLPTTGWVRAAGAAFLPVTFGVEGMVLATAYYEYHLGRVSPRDFYRRAAGVAIVPMFSAGGAIICGTAGLYAGGVGVLPGAKVCASLGAIVGIPVQYAADYFWEWYYRDFDTRQLQLVNATVEEFYGLDSASDADPR